MPKHRNFFRLGDANPGCGDSPHEQQRRSQHEHAEAPEDRRMGPVDDGFPAEHPRLEKDLLDERSQAQADVIETVFPASQQQDPDQLPHPPREQDRCRQRREPPATRPHTHPGISFPSASCDLFTESLIYFRGHGLTQIKHGLFWSVFNPSFITWLSISLLSLILVSVPSSVRGRGRARRPRRRSGPRRRWGPWGRCSRPRSSRNPSCLRRAPARR